MTASTLQCLRIVALNEMFMDLRPESRRVLTSARYEEPSRAPSDTGREGSIIARVGLEDAPWGARWGHPSGAQWRLLGPLSASSGAFHPRPGGVDQAARGRGRRADRGVSRGDHGERVLPGNVYYRPDKRRLDADDSWVVLVVHDRQMKKEEAAALNSSPRGTVGPTLRERVPLEGLRPESRPGWAVMKRSGSERRRRAVDNRLERREAVRAGVARGCSVPALEPLRGRGCSCGSKGGLRWRRRVDSGGR